MARICNEHSAICSAVAAAPQAMITARGTRSAVLHRPLECALAAHRAADHRHPLLDAEGLGERRFDIDLIADRRDREPRAVRFAGRGVDRRRPGRALAAADDVRAHDEVLVGVDRAAGTDERVPPPEQRVARFDPASRVAVARRARDTRGLRCRRDGARACPRFRTRRSRATACRPRVTRSGGLRTT